MKSANNGFRIVSVLVVLLFVEACVSRVTDAVPNPIPSQLPVIVMTLGPQTFASNVSPEPTPTAYSTQGDTLTVDLKRNYQSRLLLTIDQQLIIIPPEEWAMMGGMSHLMKSTCNLIRRLMQSILHLRDGFGYRNKWDKLKLGLCLSSPVIRATHHVRCHNSVAL